MLEASDHRSIGQRMELFHLQEEAPGSVYWHPRGFALYRRLEEYLRARMRRDGYHEVRSPQVVARSLWEQSGHWQSFHEGMLRLADDRDRNAFALKPVSCPNHVQMWKRGVRSHRELPLRLAELGACHRDEPSGSLQGLFRLRAFVQDDGHVFCREAQIDEEVGRFCAQLVEAYRAFGFDAPEVKLSLRPELRAGSDEVWDHAEAALAAAARANGIDFEVQPGQGAFYGPKLEFVLRDARGRAWQCGTIQLDLVIPERMDASYVDERGARVRPAMLHRAICGSLERFLAIVLEHHEGSLPPWLAPEAIAVASIHRAQADYARSIARRLDDAGVPVRLDVGDESLARKIVEARRLGVPIVWAVGAREGSSRSVAIRREDGSSRVVPLDDAVAEARALVRLPEIA